MAADNRGTREYMVHGKNGLVYPWDDPAGFARGIALLRGMDPARRQAMSRRCVDSVAPFDRSRSQQVMGAVYREMDRKVRERYETGPLGPVSYTHLDVYKRQSLPWIREGAMSRTSATSRICPKA